jgi:hypothetical protein
VLEVPRINKINSVSRPGGPLDVTLLAALAERTETFVVPKTEKERPG